MVLVEIGPQNLLALISTLLGIAIVLILYFFMGRSTPPVEFKEEILDEFKKIQNSFKDQNKQTLLPFLKLFETKYRILLEEYSKIKNRYFSLLGSSHDSTLLLENEVLEKENKSLKMSKKELNTQIDIIKKDFEQVYDLLSEEQKRKNEFMVQVNEKALNVDYYIQLENVFREVSKEKKNMVREIDTLRQDLLKVSEKQILNDLTKNWQSFEKKMTETVSKINVSKDTTNSIDISQSIQNLEQVFHLKNKNLSDVPSKLEAMMKQEDAIVAKLNELESLLKSNQKLSRENADLQVELSKMKSEWEKKSSQQSGNDEQERVRLAAVVEHLEKEKKELTNTMNQERREWKSVVAKIGEEVKSVNQLNKKSNEERQLLLDRIKELEEESNKMVEVDRVKETLSKDVTQFKETLKNLQNEVETLKQDKKKMSNENEILLNDIKKNHAIALEDVSKEAQYKETQYKDLLAKYVKEKQDWSVEKKSLQTDKDQEVSKIVAAHKAEVDQLNKQQSELVKGLESRQQEVQSIKNKLEEAVKNHETDMQHGHKKQSLLEKELEAEVQYLKTQLEEAMKGHESELQQGLKKQSDLTRELESHQQQVESIKANVEEASKNHGSEMQQVKANHQEEIARLTRESDEKWKRHQETLLVSQQSSSEDHVNKMKQELEEKMNKMKESAQNSGDEMNRLKAQLEQVTLEKTQANDQVSQLQVQVDKLSLDANEAQEVIGQSKQHLVQVTDAKNDLQRELEEEKRVHGEDNKKWTETMQEEKTRAEDEMNTLKQQVVDLNEEIKRLNNLLTQLKQSHVDSSEKSKLDQVKAQLEKALQDAANLQQDIVSLHETHQDQISNLIKNHQQELMNHQKQLDESKNQHDNLTLEMNQFKKQLEEQLENTTKEKNKLEKLLQDEETANQELEDDIADLELKIEDIEGSKATVDKSLCDCKEEHEKKDKRIKELEDQLSLMVITTPRDPSPKEGDKGPQTPEKPLSLNLSKVKLQHSPNKMDKQPCFSCALPAYYNDRVYAADRYFHTSCFKCGVCSLKLTVSSYKVGYKDGDFILYCQKHYVENTSHNQVLDFDTHGLTKTKSMGPKSPKREDGTTTPRDSPKIHIAYEKGKYTPLTRDDSREVKVNQDSDDINKGLQMENTMLSDKLKELEQQLSAMSSLYESSEKEKRELEEALKGVESLKGKFIKTPEGGSVLTPKSDLSGISDITASSTNSSLVTTPVGLHAYETELKNKVKNIAFPEINQSKSDLDESNGDGIDMGIY